MSMASLRSVHSVVSLAAGFVFFASAACGGQTVATDTEGGGGSTGGKGGQGATGGANGVGGKGTGGKGGRAGSGGTTAGKAGSGSGGTSTKGGAGGLPDYVDPGCPNPPAPLEDYACDPYGSFGACEFGEACYPYVSYPSTACGQEIYGARCVPAGEGQQGEGCDAGCANNHICVITGEGTQCVRLCDLSDPVPCPDGLVCGAVDIPGIGGCL